eukprot:308633-Prorocentrum_minimum.AAC.3
MGVGTRLEQLCALLLVVGAVLALAAVVQRLQHARHARVLLHIEPQLAQLQVRLEPQPAERGRRGSRR